MNIILEDAGLHVLAFSPDNFLARFNLTQRQTTRQHVSHAIQYDVLLTATSPLCPNTTGCCYGIVIFLAVPCRLRSFAV